MSAKYAKMDELLVILDWLVKQRPDSAHARFCLFSVGFDGAQVLGSTFGAASAVNRLNRFGVTLASRVRHTDLVARDFCDFWILAPQSNFDMVGCRLCEIAATVEEFGLDVVNCSIRAHAFPIANAELTGARNLIDSLRNVTPAYQFDPRRECGMQWLTKTGDVTGTWSGKSPENCARVRSVNLVTPKPESIQNDRKRS